jgi:hypothetical protein
VSIKTGEISMRKAELKITVDVDDNEDRALLHRTINASTAYSALDDIRNLVFRPARKHGYMDKQIDDLLTELGDKGLELVGLLEKQYLEVLSDNGIDLDRDLK